MSYMLEDLVVDRVDLVDEGANSAAFIELYKRKEQDKMDFTEILSKMKPEHAEVIQAELAKSAEDIATAKADLATAVSERDEAKQSLSKALEDLNTANEDLANTKTELETLKAKEADKEEACKSDQSFDETETFKSMPAEVREVFEQLKTQKEAAETELRKAKEAEQNAEAIAKAKELKSIPVEQDKLVGIIKSATPEVLDLLTTVNAAIESAVLGEVGKSAGSGATDAWSRIEAKADEKVKSGSISKAKAVSEVIRENPDLYKEYLEGGAN